MTDIENKDGLDEDFWQGNPFGCSDKQVLFVRNLIEHPGITKTEAASRAGYESSTDQGMRTIASRTWQSSKVKALFDYASTQDDIENLEIATSEETLKLLSKELRTTSNQTAKARISEILLKYHHETSQTDTSVTEEYDIACKLDDGLTGPPFFTAGVINLAANYAEGGCTKSKQWRPALKYLKCLKDYPELLESLKDKKYASYMEGIPG